MKILILGATGMVGKVLTRAALAEGHQVTTLVRNPHKLGNLEQNVTVIEGEYFDRETLLSAISGVDAVLSTIGPPMKRTPNSNEYTDAMQSMISAMQDNAVKRIVAIGGAGLRLGDEPIAFGRAMMRRVLILLSGANYLDKEREHNALFSSDLDWTIVRPPQITDAEGELTVTSDKVQAFKVDTCQLARFMLDCLEDDSTVKTAPFVSTVKL
ncbi:MAG: NAD(P)H-binding protein [Pseudomonadota bacterium]